MRLWLLRHGQAEPKHTKDSLRALTTQGLGEVTQSAAHLIGRPIDLILSSPYVRAQQTAAQMFLGLDKNPVLQTVKWLTPNTTPQQALHALSSYSAPEILVVSHLPLIGLLASLLEHGHTQQPEEFSTATLLGLEGAAVAAGSFSHVLWFTPQNQTR